jgi:hypothetical protein
MPGNVKLLVDANRTTNADASSSQPIRQLVIGALWSPNKDLDFDVWLSAR